MKDGHYYLPAFSIPYAGRDIAKLHGKDPDVFWQEHYGAALGRAKAKLLLRYGLQLETPNTQNILIQLDRNLLPTGRIVFRDLSDSFFVKPVAEALGYGKQMEHDLSIDYKPQEVLKPFWRNSAWRLDEAAKRSFSDRTLDAWGRVHNNAYKQEIEGALGMSVPVSSDGVIKAVESILFSDIGLRKLERYQRARIEAERREQSVAQSKSGNGLEKKSGVWQNKP